MDNPKKSILIDLSYSEYFEFLKYLKEEVINPIPKKDIELYLMALDKRIPENWGVVLENFKNNQDPEYVEYLRLKNKFE
jgi:hypothetical protein